MTNDLYQECFGHCRRDADCRDCELFASCVCISDTEAGIERHSGMTSVEELEGWSRKLSTPPVLPDDGDADADGDAAAAAQTGALTGDLARLAEFCRYLFSLDDYTLGILAEIIVPGDPAARVCTVSDLARVHRCSRQAMHRKMLASVRRHPELAQLFRVAVRKIGRSRGLLNGREKCRA